MVGTTPKTYFRLGYGFARSRNGAHNMHAALCIPSVTGAWLNEGGGGFHNNGAIYHWNKTLIEGLDVADPKVRVFDQSRIGPVLTGDPDDLKGGPPVTALFIQNTNPVQVAPEQRKVKAGFAREDLFVCVHEQFMTATAQMADVVLPATMFLEHDDVYQGGGHQHILLGPKLIEVPGECRSNHDVIVRARQARRRRAQGLRHEPARDHRLDAAEIGLGHAGGAGSQEVDRLPARVRRGALHRGLPLPRQEVPLQAGLAQRSGAARQRLPRSTATCRACPTTGTWSRRRTRSIRSGSPPARRANTSTPRSTRCRPSRKRHGPPRVKVHPDDLAGARRRRRRARAHGQ